MLPIHYYQKLQINVTCIILRLTVSYRCSASFSLLHFLKHMYNPIQSLSARCPWFSKGCVYPNKRTDCVCLFLMKNRWGGLSRPSWFSYIFTKVRNEGTAFPRAITAAATQLPVNGAEKSQVHAPSTGTKLIKLSLLRLKKITFSAPSKEKDVAFPPSSPRAVPLYTGALGSTQ